MGKMANEIKIEVTPQIAAAVFDALPELIPQWIGECGGIGAMAESLGYANANVASRQMGLRAKKKGSYLVFKRWVDAIAAAQENNSGES